MAAASDPDAEWDRCHRPAASVTGTTTAPVPSRLYTDENPATTIKGTGFKNRAAAVRTISLTSQPGVRYKQYWTIRAMRERAAHHPHPTPGMRDAISVFDDWLNRYVAPSDDERRRQKEEWMRHCELCSSAANAHSYGASPSRDELKRARDDTREGRRCLLNAIRRHRKQELRERFPVTAFAAVFGAPGLHGYGRHTLQIDDDVSNVVIEGQEGLKEVLGDEASTLGYAPKRIVVCYDRRKEVARAEVEHGKGFATLKRLWEHSTSSNQGVENNCKNGHTHNKEPYWTCKSCTLVHTGQTKQIFLACELCGAARSAIKEGKDVASASNVHRQPSASSAVVVSSSELFQTMDSASQMRRPEPKRHSPCPSATWGCLRAPSDRDIRGSSRKRRKGLDAPPPTLEYLCVLDFEWTADKKRKIEPISEITQFPSVLLKLVDGTKKRSGAEKSAIAPPMMQHSLLADLAASASPITRKDAYGVSLFDTYVKPTLNPTLTQFSIDLTAITQADVDAAPTISEALRRYLRWLRSLGLIDDEGSRLGHWCFATWGDVDIMSTLRIELRHKRIALPRCFDRWINLKDDAMFKRHYGREPRGGLKACVESVGERWEGRAHNGLVDSVNTAKIVRNMVRTGFRFTRPTRGLDGDGTPYGQKKSGRPNIIV